MQVGLIGAGNMARALARGWNQPILCSDSGSGHARALVDEVGGEALRSNAEVAARADLVVLCHKPAQLEGVAEEIAASRKPVASILGGTSTAALQRSYPDSQVFALMPNTPVEVRRGVIIYAVREAELVDSVDPEVEALVLQLFAELGTVVPLAERLLPAATGVSGVGPAYQALLAEAQVDAAVRHGIPPAVASVLVMETLAGTATLLERREYDTLAVRREVTSPGGSTARGLNALEHREVRAAFQDALDAVVGPQGSQ
jgi:pyrroline-5-carboxylate reductase